MKSWPPNDSSRNSSNNDSFSSFHSPPTVPKRNVSTSIMTPRKTAVSSSSTSNTTHHHHHQTFEEAPRMQLFETKAQVQYLDDEDDIAAAAYGDRSPVKKSSTKQRKEGVSGYDFGTLLKDKKIEYNPWG